MVTKRNGSHKLKKSSTNASEEVSASQSRRFANNEPVTITREILAEEVTKAIQVAMPAFIQQMTENAMCQNLGRLPEFTGVHDPVATMLWVSEMDNFFNSVNCVDENKVSYAVAMLRSEAIIWWDMVKDKSGPTQMTWTKFKETFKTEFSPESMVTELEDEYMRLEQGSRTVDEYASRFLTLGWVTGFPFDPTEDRKVNRFVSRLNGNLRAYVLVRQSATVQGAVMAARQIEYNKNKELKRKREESGNSHGSKGCYRCGEVGHLARECPRI